MSFLKIIRAKKVIEYSVDKNIDGSAYIPNTNELSEWIMLAITKEVKSPQLSVNIVDIRNITDLNNRFRSKNKATNVLSFPSKLPKNSPINYLGDLVLCAEVINNEAIEQKKSSISHWAHMTIHGTLHLLGYNHEDKEEAIEMETLEVKLLKELGYANPYEAPPK
jgi:probable rRNA maturation factor